jgi:hypothetical protein
MLVCGDVGGKWEELYQRVKVVNKKNGPFHMLLCVGDFFGKGFQETEAEASDRLALITEPPIPTFILGPTAQDQVGNYTDISGCEIGSSGIIYLGPFKVQ